MTRFTFTSPWFKYDLSKDLPSHRIIDFSDGPLSESDPAFPEYARVRDLLEVCKAQKVERTYNVYLMHDDDFARFKKYISNNSRVDRIYGPKSDNYGDPIPVVRSANWKPTFRMQMLEYARIDLWEMHVDVMGTKDPDIVKISVSGQTWTCKLQELIKKIDNCEHDWHVIEIPDLRALVRSKNEINRIEFSVKRNWSGYFAAQMQSDYAAG